MYKIIPIILLIAACGSENHSYGWEYDYKYNGMRVRGESRLTPDQMYAVYEKAVQCFGDTPPPFIIYTAQIEPDDKTTGRCGRASYGPPLVLIRSTCMNQEDILAHEITHYFGFHGHKEEFKTALRCINQGD